MSTVIHCKFKKISLKSDFIHFFFMILYMYIAPGQGQTAPREQSLVTSFTASLKKMSLNFFHD